MIRLSARREGSTYSIRLFDDQDATNDPAQWLDLLDGATTVAGEWRAARSYNADGEVINWTQWSSFSINLEKPQGWAKRVLRRDLSGVPEGEYQIQFSIDGGPVLGPWSVRF